MKMKVEEEKNEEFFYWRYELHFYREKTSTLAESNYVYIFLIALLLLEI